MGGTWAPCKLFWKKTRDITDSATRIYLFASVYPLFLHPSYILLSITLINSLMSSLPPSVTSLSAKHRAEDPYSDSIHLKHAELLLEFADSNEAQEDIASSTASSREHSDEETETDEEMLNASSSNSSPQQEEERKAAPVSRINLKGIRRCRRQSVEWTEDVHNAFISVHKLPDSFRESELYRFLVKHCPPNTWVNKLKLTRVAVAKEATDENNLKERYIPFFPHIKRDLNNGIRHQVIEAGDCETQPGMVMCLSPFKNEFIRVNTARR